MKVLKMKPGDSNYYLFENLPKTLYGDSTPIKNIDRDFLVNCYVLVSEGEPKARLALYKNPAMILDNKPTVCIGCYESVEDVEIANAIISAAIQDAKLLEAKYVIGPMNGSTWNEYRFSTSQIYPGFFMEPKHALFYNDQFISSGFKVMAKYFSSLDTKIIYDHPAVLEREEYFVSRGVRFRSIDLENYEEELEQLYPFISNAFKTNFLYTPIPWSSFNEKYQQAKAVIDPRFVLLAEDAQQNIIGLFFCLPDVLNKHEKSLIVKTVARKPSDEWRGLGHVLGNRVYRAAAKKGYTSIVHAFLKEQGTSTTISNNFSGEVYKKYALYGKEIK